MEGDPKICRECRHFGGVYCVHPDSRRVDRVRGEYWLAASERRESRLGSMYKDACGYDGLQWEAEPPPPRLNRFVVVIWWIAAAIAVVSAYEVWSW